jgi:hypothetical protein
MLLKSKVSVLLAGICLASIPTFASLTFVSCVSGVGCLNPNDSVLWSQLGGDSTAVANGTLVHSTGGIFVTANFGTAPNDGEVVDAGTSWPSGGGINSGDALLWGFDNGTSTGTGPLTFSLALAVNGIGGWVQADTPGSPALCSPNCQYTAQLQLYNGASLSGTGTVTSDLAGDPIFIAGLWSPAAANITKAVFSLTSCVACNGNGDLGDFVVDSLLLNDTTTPEPSSLFLMAAGLAGLVWRYGYRSKNGRNS